MNDIKNTSAVSRLAMLREDCADAEKEFLEIVRFLAPPDADDSVVCPKQDAGTALREDIPQEGIAKAALLAAAPAVCDGYITVPKALEDAG